MTGVPLMREISGGIIFPKSGNFIVASRTNKLGSHQVDTKQNYRYKLDVFLKERYNDRFKGCTWCAPL